MKNERGLEITVGKTYSRQFVNKPTMKIKEIKTESRPHHEYRSYIVDMFSEDGVTVERGLEQYDIDFLCYREYDPNLKSVPYTGNISQGDIDCIQDGFEEKITEDMVRQAINENNWGGDFTDSLNLFGIEGDSDNRDSVHEMLKKTFNLK